MQDRWSGCESIINPRKALKLSIAYQREDSGGVAVEGGDPGTTAGRTDQGDYIVFDR